MSLQHRDPQKWNHKKDQKYDLLLEDFKKLGLENEKMKKGMKGKVNNPRKKAKTKKDKRVKDLQKKSGSFEEASPSNQEGSDRNF